MSTNPGVPFLDPDEQIEGDPSTAVPVDPFLDITTQGDGSDTIVYDDLISEQYALDEDPEVYDPDAIVEAIEAGETSDITTPPIPIGRTWAFDFDKSLLGDNTTPPRRLEGNDALVIQQWIRRALSTERFAFDVYPDDYGVRLAEIFSGTIESAVGTVTENIHDALLFHDRITRVEDIEVVVEPPDLMVSCTVYLDDGQTVPFNGRFDGLVIA